MIAQCKICQTRFRLDDALIEGEGIWVRCNQCKNVFFLGSPAGKAESSGEKAKAEVVERVKEPALQTKRETAESSQYVKLPEDIEKEVEDIAASGDKREITREKEEKGQISSRGRQLVYLLVVLLLGGAYFAFFADTGWQTAFDKLFGINKKTEEVGPAQVELTDVRQRMVNNVTLGTIRVLEGNAINRSPFPMTRIKIKGEITDAYTVVLGVKESYCGNLLNADELATMTEDQIQKELSNPQGSDVSNDRVLPQGQIPFMIVFTREPAGVVKTFAIPSVAERLLP
ncbi:MAG TPA: DUF3426 domain-containing protein [Syntrophales bacterium]|nr:DUF3426 domain-containing protein [Syntrophales bacterium]